MSIGSNFKVYKSGWGGNQYVTTVKIAGFVAKAGMFLAGAATVWDWINVGKGELSSTHVSINTGFTAVGVFGGPTGAVVAVPYTLVDNFYPGGWVGGGSSQTYNGAGALSDLGTLVKDNQKIVPGWRLRDPGGF